ncbi:S8 family serine peptidase [bacterium]|nr:S8 family serine peptidase [bacterium]
MNTPRSIRSSTVALALLLSLSTALATEREAAPGELLVRLSVDALDPGKRALSATTLERLQTEHGILALDPLLAIGPTPGRPGGGLLARYGLDRIRVARVAPATPMAELAALAKRLETDASIEVAQPNWIGRAGGIALPVTADTHFASQWHLNNDGQSGGIPGADANVTESWQITVGRSETTVALLDSGIDGDHREFRGRILPGGWDTANDDPDPEDNHGHGTQVWGIVGATPNNDFAVAGINWRAGVLPFKVLVTAGGTVGGLIAGLARLAVSGADIANMSLIGFRESPLLADAIAAAHEAGVVMIGCNGNDGSTTINYPSAYPQVFATGWTDRHDERSGDSNRTPTLDIVAPGVDIATVQYASLQDNASPFSGCSAATPSATGVASLLLGLDPTLTFEQVRDILRSTAADEVGPPGFDLPGRDDDYGWGRLDALAAIRALGLVSDGRIHVEQIDFRRVDNDRLEIHVLVLDDLQGLERDVAVTGQLTTAERETALLNAVTTANGIAVLTYEPAGGLPDGAFTFEVEQLTADGREWDPGMDAVGAYRSDPLKIAIHVGAISMYPLQQAVAIEVRVLDDDELPQGNVNVAARLTPPSGPEQILMASTQWAASGVARFEYEPDGDLAPGTYTFDILQLQRQGFAYDAERNVASSASIDVLVPTDDLDADGVPNASDNCLQTANPDQDDRDGDGLGDVCDVCPGRVDPAQRDSDGDGLGNRCDCAPYDSSRTGLADVRVLDWDGPDHLTWHGTVGADRYDLLRGHVADLNGADYGNCLADDVTGFTWSTPEAPDPGEGFFYLVRGDDATCGNGPLGTTATGASRINTNPDRCDPL